MVVGWIAIVQFVLRMMNCMHVVVMKYPGWMRALASKNFKKSDIRDQYIKHSSYLHLSLMRHLKALTLKLKQIEWKSPN